ncbi:hypothetical protein QSU93_06930 [Limosilactobacillus fermentum]|uniref:hypothetical protein n=1 Tax=Limosilactobacillus fermentum TaxID=1613 RepID=UPI0025702DE7|nr:hypothetical protein [Limosilactobacillus fermentum]WJD84208.1 hypothetical protein QSU93_06930 [Limosilactobacillus fermentum]
MKRNIDLMITAIETTILGFVLIFNHPYDDQTHPVFHAFNLLQGWPMCASLLIIGIAVLILTISNYHKHYADFMANIVMGALWMGYFVSFLVHDSFVNTSVSVDTALIGFVFVRVVLDAFRHYERGVWVGG